MFILCHPVILFLEILMFQIAVECLCPMMFTAVEITIAKKEKSWKTPRCSSIMEWLEWVITTQCSHLSDMAINLWYISNLKNIKLYIHQHCNYVKYIYSFMAHTVYSLYCAFLYFPNFLQWSCIISTVSLSF